MKRTRSETKRHFTIELSADRISGQQEEDQNTSSKKLKMQSSVRLVKWNRERVLDVSQKLTDNEIFAASQILRQQFHEINGLIDPISTNSIRCERFHLNDMNKRGFVQILNLDYIHWLTISNIFSTHANEVKVYDSFFNNSSNSPIADLIRSKLNNLIMSPSERSLNEQIKLNCSVEFVQQQSNISLCGVFAIAFAFDLCFGVDPTTRIYEESQMRLHLERCLNQNYFENFPVKTSRKRTHSFEPITENFTKSYQSNSTMTSNKQGKNLYYR